MSLLDPSKTLGLSIDDLPVREVFNEFGPAALYEDESGTFYEFYKHGLSLFADIEGRISVIHYHGHAIERYTSYTGQLPSQLTFDMPRPAIIERLGVPTVTGGEHRSTLLGGEIARWIRYDFPGYSLHVEFSNVDTIELLTLMLPHAVPER